MIEIEKPRIEIEKLSEDGSYGRFVVEPLERGFARGGIFQPVRSDGDNGSLLLVPCG